MTIKMTDTHRTAPTRFVELDCAKFAYRRFGKPFTGQPPQFFLQHYRGGTDNWDAFLSTLPDDDLHINGDMVQLLWFQRLTEFLKPATA